MCSAVDSVGPSGVLQKHYAMAGGGVQVHIVDADTCAHEDAQIWQPIKDLVVVADGGGGQNRLGRLGAAHWVSRVGDQARDR